MEIRQGDLVWVDFSPSKGSEPKGTRPALVLQDNRFNRSRINTIIVAAITSQLKYEGMPGNVRLARKEGGMPKPSVINISQIRTLDRNYISKKIGSLSAKRWREVALGLQLVFGLDT